MLDGKELLKRLTETPGGPGDESRVARALQDAAQAVVDEVSVDAIGNVILHKRGSSGKPRVMLAAHMDEIMLMVMKIEKGGYLRVAQVGGFDPRTLLGQEVVVHGKKDLVGIVGSKPPHLSSAEERKKSVPLRDLFIDVGMKEESVRQTVRVGDRVSIKRDAMELVGGRLAGKAMDDRACVAAMVMCLHELEKLRAQADVYAVGTVQEEIGTKGAQTAAFGIKPDLAIAIDVCHGETPGVSADLVHKIGKGPVLSFGPFIHPKLFTKLKEMAEEAGIPVQIEVGQANTWTDGDPIQITQAGIPTAVLSVPLRYMHTSVETLAFSDVRNTAVLLARFIADIDQAFVEGLTCYLKD